MFLTCFPNGGSLVAAAVITRSHLVASYFPVGEWSSLFCDVKVREDDDESVAESRELGFFFVLLLYVSCFFWVFFSFLSRNCLCCFFSRIFFSHQGRKEGKGRTDWCRIILAFCFCFCCWWWFLIYFVCWRSQ